jgi:RNA-directed DNA polymerase
MKRSPVSLAMVADLDNLVCAAVAAGRGKRFRDEVISFFNDFELNIMQLRENILSCKAPMGAMRHFRIFDPKERIISAPCFPDRVLHHALINHIGPVIDTRMVDDSYACRLGKGCHAAIRRVQQFSRRFPWYVKIDIRHYFENIDHALLVKLLADTFKDAGLQALLGRIVAGYSVIPGKGLPIGSLTSQYFANYYLNRLDRYLLEGLRVRGMVRYMDDVIWWCSDGLTARETLGKTAAFIEYELSLTVKPDPQINRSDRGISFCGMRIFPGTILLGKRRRTRFTARRRHWEELHTNGVITSEKLQRSMDGVAGITAGAHAHAWRGRQLLLRPAADA